MKWLSSDVQALLQILFVMKLVNYIHSINIDIDNLKNKRCFWILWIVNCELLYIYIYIYIYIWLCMIELIWWLNYVFKCKNFGWNKTSVLGVEGKSRYHMHLYDSVLNWYDVWWLNYMFICNHFGWNETIVLGLKGNQYTMVTYASICFNIKLIWYVMIELYVYMLPF